MRRVARDAAQSTADHSTEMTLAAVCLALHEEYGFGRYRCMKMLESVNRLCFHSLCAGELVERVRACMGISIGGREQGAERS